jgi:hypothetical protein
MSWTALLAISAVVIRLSAQNDSREAGTAKLESLGRTTRVTITVTGEPPGAVQPANVHAGRCDSVERIRYPLNNALKGRSTSIVPESLGNLRKGPYAIVLQDSPASLRAAKEYKYVSCGSI